MSRGPPPLMLVAIVALVAAGAGLRLWRLDADPLWLDEAYSAYAAGRGWAFLWQVVPTYETHPPFYYSLVRLWTLAFGDSVLALRALGAAAAIATLPLVALAAREAGQAAGLDPKARRWLVLIALGLTVASYPLVIMAREVRPYPVLILAYTAALATILRLQGRTATGRPLAGRTYAAYLLLLALILWLHNLGVLYAAGLGLALLAAVLRRGTIRADWTWLVGGHAIVIALWLPALAMLADQAPTWMSSTWLKVNVAGLPDRLRLLYAAPGLAGLIATLALIGSAIIGVRGRGERRRTVGLLLAAAVVPVALALAITFTIAPVFITRTMTAVAVPTLLLAALGASLAGRLRVAALVLAVVMAGAWLGADVRAMAGPPKQDWRGLVAWLAPRLKPGDRIYAYPNEGALPLAFALREAGVIVPLRAIPGPVPARAVAGAWYPTGSRGVVSLPRAGLRRIAEDATSRGTSTIWLLRLGANAYDVGDMFLEELLVDRRMTARWLKEPIDVAGLSKPLPPARGRGHIVIDSVAPAAAAAAR